MLSLVTLYRPAISNSPLVGATSRATMHCPSPIARLRAFSPRIDVVETWGFDQRPPVSTVCSYFTHLHNVFASVSHSHCSSSLFILFYNAVAKRADFLVGGVVRRRRAFWGLKLRPRKSEKGACEFFPIFSDEIFASQPKKCLIESRTKKSVPGSANVSSLSSDVTDFFVRKARTTPRTRKSVRVATA